MQFLLDMIQSSNLHTL